MLRMAINYTRAIPAVQGENPTSWHYNRLAKAFNDRLLNGVGDPTWRIFWYSHSLFRNMRNPSDQFTYPAADEWWKFYAFIDPEKNPNDQWPTAGPGEAGGANVSNPIMAYVYGVEAAELESEAFRFGAITLSFTGYAPEDVHETEKFSPLFRGVTAADESLFGTVHLPISNFEQWEMAKSQRGGITSDASIAYAPALEVPRGFFNFNYPAEAPYLKSFTSFQPYPDSGTPQRCPPLCETCPSYPNLLYKFSPLKPGLPVITFPGSCMDKVGHVVHIYRGHDVYVVYTNAGNGRYGRTILKYTDYIEGPYSGGGEVSKVTGSQIEQSINRYADAFKGSLDDRAENDYSVCTYSSDFQRFFSRQYSLAPALSTFTGEYLTPIYPSTEANGTGSTYTILPNDDLPLDYNDEIPEGFCAAGYYVYLFRAQPNTTFQLLISHAGGEVPINLTTNADGNAEELKYLVAPLYGTITLKNGPTQSIVLSAGDTNPVPFDRQDLPGKFKFELAIIQKRKPEVVDAYTVLRLASANESLDGIDGRGEDFAGQAAILETYFSAGLLTGPLFSVASNDFVNTNPIYDSARLLVKDNLRMIPREAFRGYEVIEEEGIQKSVLYFSRYSSLTPAGFYTQTVDLSRPTDEPITEQGNLLEPNTTYIVGIRNSGSGEFGSTTLNERYGTLESAQTKYVNFPVEYLPSGGVNTAVNRVYVGSFFTTPEIVTLVVTPTSEQLPSRPGVDGVIPGRQYNGLAWSNDEDTKLQTCWIERRKSESGEVVEDWKVLKRFDSTGELQSFTHSDFDISYGDLEYRARFGDITLSYGDQEVFVVKASYFGTAPDKPKYVCGAGHSYLCPGVEYVVGGEKAFGVSTATGTEVMVETEPGIWLVASDGSYSTDFDFENNQVPVFVPAGTNFVCPAGVTGFTLIPPTGPTPIADNTTIGNGTTTVSPVTYPNIEVGERYRVDGSGFVEYNERLIPAGKGACSVFGSDGIGSASGDCSEFIGVENAAIARMVTGNERLIRITQEATVADGLDQFLDLGPSRMGMTKIQSGVSYIVSATSTGYVEYNGSNYSNGQKFVGAIVDDLPVETFTPFPAVGEPEDSVQVYEFDGIRNVAPMKGNTNQWSMFTTFNAYHWSESSIWKSSNYGDQLPFLHNRCNFYSPDWIKPEHENLLQEFAMGQKPVFVAETPSGYTYIKGTNNPPTSWDVQSRVNYFRSCQIYKPDIRVERAEMGLGSNEIKLVLSGRLQNCGANGGDGSPSSLTTISRDYYSPASPSFASRVAALRAEPYKTDENSILEYVLCLFTGCDTANGTGDVRHCLRNRMGDGAAGTVLWGLPDDPFGSCFPRFYFTKLVPYAWPYEEGASIIRSEFLPNCARNTKLSTAPFVQMQFYLEAMAGGYIDNRSTKGGLDCSDLTSKLFDYSFPQLCYQSIIDSSSVVKADATPEVLITKRYRISWTQGSVEDEPEYVIERAVVPLVNGGPGAITWKTIATLQNTGVLGTRTYDDELSYSVGTVHSIQYRVSGLKPTEVTGNIENSGTTFTERVIAWEVIPVASVEIGREVTKLP